VSARAASAASAATPVSLVPFAAVSCTYFASVGLFNPYAPLWFKHLGFSTLAIGVLASLQAWTRVVAPYAWGWLADHTGRRVELLRLAALLAAVASIGLFFSERYGAVALCVGLLFLANGGIVPLSEAALAQHLQTAKGLDSVRYGRVRVWGSIGFIAAVLLFGRLLESFSIATFPWWMSGALALLVLASLRLPRVAEAAPRADEGQAGVWAVLRQPAVAWFFAAVFFTVLAHTGLYAFFSLYLDALGYGKAAVGLLWAVGVAVEIGFFFLQGRFFHRFSPQGWLLLAAGLSVLRFAATAAGGGSVVVLVAAQALHAITFAAQHAACIALVNQHFPGRLRGRGQALYTTLGYGFSGVLGGVAGGALSERFGLASVFWAGALMALLAMGCCWQLIRAHGPSARPAVRRV